MALLASKWLDFLSEKMKKDQNPIDLDFSGKSPMVT
jgi:hypothetical protein